MSSSRWCEHCTLRPRQAGRTLCSGCRQYQRRYGCLPNAEYIEKLAARNWARFGGSNRVRSRRALEVGKGHDIEDMSFIESSWRPHKTKTSDPASFDADDNETALAAAQTPAVKPSWELRQPSTLEIPAGPRIARSGDNLPLENGGKVIAVDPDSSRDDIRDRAVADSAPKRPFLVGPNTPIPESALLARQRAITETEYVEQLARRWWRDITPRWDDVCTGRIAGPSGCARIRRLYRTILRGDDDLFGRVERRVEQLIEETRQRDGTAFADSQPTLRIPERAAGTSQRTA